jgi:hypothetical protein
LLVIVLVLLLALVLALDDGDDDDDDDESEEDWRRSKAAAAMQRRRAQAAPRLRPTMSASDGASALDEWRGPAVATRDDVAPMLPFVAPLPLLLVAGVGGASVALQSRRTHAHEPSARLRLSASLSSPLSSSILVLSVLYRD